MKLILVLVFSMSFLHPVWAEEDYHHSEYGSGYYDESDSYGDEQEQYEDEYGEENYQDDAYSDE